MGYRCCGMTDYYALTGIDISDSVASSSSCSAPAAPGNGTYAAGDICATAGATLYSGNTCTPVCNSGFKASGITRCVKGALAETASCVVDAGATTTTTVTTSTTAGSALADTALGSKKPWTAVGVATFGLALVQ